MQIKYIKEDGIPKLRFFNDEKLKKYSIHTWCIDDRYKNNCSRKDISGWVGSEIYDVEISNPGTYYGRILTPGKRFKNTEKLSISFADLFCEEDTYMVEKIQEERANNYSIETLLEKVAIVGVDKIAELLKKKLGKKNLVFYSSQKNVSLANTIFSDSFFNGNMQTPKFIGDDTFENGYLFSMTFRSKYEIFSSKKLSENDFVLLFDEPSQKLLDKLSEEMVIAYDFAQLVQEAFVDKYLLDVLYKQNTQTVYIAFPTAKKVKNKSNVDKIAANTTIGSLRTKAKQGIYPYALKEFSKDYCQNVINGWTLVNQEEGYDRLADYQSQFVNVRGGKRVIPENGTKLIGEGGRIMFYGNSVMYGIGSDDENTLPSIVAKNTGFIVENNANFSMNDFVRATNLIDVTNFNRDDIIVFGSHLELTDEQQKKVDIYIDMQEFFEYTKERREVFIDITHLNKYGYEIMANILIDRVIGRI
jgi:hypothetical protein